MNYCIEKSEIEIYREGGRKGRAEMRERDGETTIRLTVRKIDTNIKAAEAEAVAGTLTKN